MESVHGFPEPHAKRLTSYSWPSCESGKYIVFFFQESELGKCVRVYAMRTIFHHEQIGIENSPAKDQRVQVIEIICSSPWYELVCTRLQSIARKLLKIMLFIAAHDRKVAFPT